MPLDPDESSFFELHPELSRALRRIRNVGLVYDRAKETGGLSGGRSPIPKGTHRMRSSDHVRITRFSSAPTAKPLHSKPKPVALQNPSS